MTLVSSLAAKTNTLLRHKRLIWIGVGMAIITAVLGCCILIQRHKLFAQIGKYYAVFLTNDQVYFGKIAHKSDREFTLTNVYYLKANTAVSLQNGEVSQGDTTTAQLSLIKLGKELYGPKNELVINWQHVLFYQEMNGQSEVMNAIKKQELKQ